MVVLSSGRLCFHIYFPRQVQYCHPASHQRNLELSLLPMHTTVVPVYDLAVNKLCLSAALLSDLAAAAAPTEVIRLLTHTGYHHRIHARTVSVY
jgi:hypothetical protein